MKVLSFDINLLDETRFEERRFQPLSILRVFLAQITSSKLMQWLRGARTPDQN